MEDSSTAVNSNNSPFPIPSVCTSPLHMPTFPLCTDTISKQINVDDDDDDDTEMIITRLSIERDSAVLSCSESEERLSALMEAIRLLSNLAETKSDDTAVPIHKRFDELHSTWKFEETPLPCLLASITRLRSNVEILSREADVASTEIQTLRESLKETNQTNKKLEKALNVLCKTNDKLKRKMTTLIEKKRERNNIFRSVKDYVSNVQLKEKREEERSAKMKVRMHERVLNAGCCSAEKLDPADSDEESSVYSSSSSLSSSSLITDDGVATVSLSFNEEGGWGAVPSLSFTDGDEHSSPVDRHKQRQEPGWPHNNNKLYTLIFQKGTNIGLQFQKVPMDNNNKGATPKRGILNTMIQNDLENDDDAASATLRNATPNAEGTLLVRSFLGFDNSANVRPTLGAMLIAINDESVERCTYTPDQLHAKIQNTTSSITLTFRNDVLDKCQTEILDKAYSSSIELGPNGCGFSVAIPQRDDVSPDVGSSPRSGDGVSPMNRFHQLKDALPHVKDFAIFSDAHQQQQQQHADHDRDKGHKCDGVSLAVGSTTAGINVVKAGKSPDEHENENEDSSNVEKKANGTVSRGAMSMRKLDLTGSWHRIKFF